MILKTSTHSHAQNECAITIRRSNIYGEGGRLTGCKETWDIQGEIFADSQAALTTTINALKTAYAGDIGDIGLYLDDGVTRTSHYISADDTTSGVLVLDGPSFPEGRGANYSTFRTYTITVEAEFEADGSGGNSGLMAWEETLDVQGTGGPEFVLVEVVNGRWPRQAVSTHSAVIARQSGMAVGRDRYPTVPPPIFGGHEHPSQRRVTRSRPRREGSETIRDYEISWEYTFESGGALRGEPNNPPR